MTQGRDVRAKKALIAAGLVAVAFGSAGIVWALLDAGPTPDAAGPAVIEPAQETSPGAAGGLASASPATAESSAPPSSALLPGQEPPLRSPDGLIAYRKSGELYVGTGSGTAATVVARSGEGPYALSPDGRVLAHVTGGRLWLVTVDDGRAVDAGAASGEDPGLGECPVWSPDSKYVYFTRAGAGGRAEVWRVTAAGGEAERVMSGGCPSLSPGGRVLAAVDAGGVMVSVAGAAPRLIAVAGATPVAVAAGDAELFVALIDVSGGSAIERMAIDGGRRTRVAGPPVDAPRATWGVLRLSPDGARLAVAAVGDDRYSRLSLFDLGSGRVTPVSSRRDTYVRYWDAGSRFLYYVEGNAYQGETTRFMRVEPSGLGRALVVDGAE